METVIRVEGGGWVAPPPLQVAEIHAWFVRLGSPQSVGSSRANILSSEEKEKAARFKRETDRHRYVASHFALRSLLAGYLGIQPAKIQFQTEQFGKPILDSRLNHANLTFNLAHSGDLALIGVAMGVRLGVDIELWRPDAVNPGVMARFCSPAELRMIQRADGNAKLVTFFRQWTAKEAYLKAVGCGLVDEVCSVEIPFPVGTSRVPLKIEKWLPPQLDPVQNWLVYDLEVLEGYSAALVVESRETFAFRKFTTSLD